MPPFNRVGRLPPPQPTPEEIEKAKKAEKETRERAEAAQKKKAIERIANSALRRKPAPVVVKAQPTSVPKETKPLAEEPQEDFEPMADETNPDAETDY